MFILVLLLTGCVRGRWLTNSVTSTTNPFRTELPINAVTDSEFTSTGGTVDRDLTSSATTTAAESGASDGMRLQASSSAHVRSMADI